MRLKTMIAAAALGGAAMLTVPLAASPASAAPGDPCSLAISFFGVPFFSAPGTQTATNTCVPGVPLPPPFNVFNQGLPCGTTTTFLFFTVQVTC